jgi:hypothetical protein
MVSGQRHAPAALYHRGNDPRYPLYRKLGETQSRSGHRGYSKNDLAPAGDRNSITRSSSSQLDTVMIELPGSPDGLHYTRKCKQSLHDEIHNRHKNCQHKLRLSQEKQHFARNKKCTAFTTSNNRSSGETPQSNTRTFYWYPLLLSFHNKWNQNTQLSVGETGL